MSPAHCATSLAAECLCDLTAPDAASFKYRLVDVREVVGECCGSISKFFVHFVRDDGGRGRGPAGGGAGRLAATVACSAQ